MTQTALVVFLWSFIVIYSPMVSWIFALHLQTTWAHSLMNLTDFITNVLLSLPAAFVLIRLRPPRLGLYLLLAVLPSFALINYHITGSDFLSGIRVGFIAGWVSELAALPVAAYLLRAVMKPRPPNRESRQDEGIASA